jgi:hypothetical protein
MLQNLSEEIRECLRRAEECRQLAEAALVESTKTDYFEMEQRWLNLARTMNFQKDCRGSPRRRPANASQRRNRAASVGGCGRKFHRGASHIAPNPTPRKSVTAIVLRIRLRRYCGISDKKIQEAAFQTRDEFGPPVSFTTPLLPCLIWRLSSWARIDV